MIAKEVERLAVLEIKVDSLKADVSEIKSDMKSLLIASTINATANRVTAEARSSTMTWARTALPPILAGIAAYVLSKVT